MYYCIYSSWCLSIELYHICVTVQIQIQYNIAFDDKKKAKRINLLTALCLYITTTRERTRIKKKLNVYCVNCKVYVVKR